MREGREQFPLIQGLRGMAALLVLLYHMAEAGHVDQLLAHAPPLAFLCRNGWIGVPVFFALSGFVIAHSLNGHSIDARFLGRFALRRSVRLDPPYWASILLALALEIVAAQVKGASPQLPSATALLAHLSYTQILLGQGDISGVYWTLTYEVQFYLVLAASLMLLGPARQRLGPSSGAFAIFAPLLLVAMAWGAGFVADPLWPGLFIGLWSCFFAGALAYWASCRRGARMALLLLGTLMLLSGPASMKLSALTALLLHGAALTGLLHGGLAWPWLQGLGAISYSLYLIHNPVSGAAFFLTKRLLPPGAAAEALQATVVIATCLVAAGLFWFAIERPSQRLARNLGQSRRGAFLPLLRREAEGR